MTHILVSLWMMLAPWNAQILAPILFGPAPASGGGITLVTHAIANTTDENTVTTPAKNTTGANLIVLVCVTNNSGICGGVTSSPTACTFTPLTSYNFFDSVQIFYCYGPTTNASQTFGMNQTNTGPCLGMMAFSGTIGSTVDQQNGHAATSAATTVQAGSITPGHNNTVVVYGYSSDGNAAPGTITLSGPSTLDIGLATVSLATNCATAYAVQTTATATNPTWSTTVSNNLGANVASFQ
jgi:hypothetical protein